MPSILIIGSGPAGLSAAIYAARAGIQTIVAYKDGGALEKTDKIENYFGFVDVISGPELTCARARTGGASGRTADPDRGHGVEYAKKGFTVKTTQGTFAVDAVTFSQPVRHAPRPDPGRAGIGRARCQLLRDLRRVFLPRQGRCGVG